MTRQLLARLVPLHTLDERSTCSLVPGCALDCCARTVRHAALRPAPPLDLDERGALARAHFWLHLAVDAARSYSPSAISLMAFLSASSSGGSVSGLSLRAISIAVLPGLSWNRCDRSM